jgi:hypothetical protein
MKLTALQEQACQSLKDALESDGNEDMLSPIEDDSVIHSDIEDSDDEVEDSDDEVEDSDDGLRCSDDISGDVIGQSDMLHPITGNTVQRHILYLLVALFTHLPAGKYDKFYSPILRFLVLFSIMGNGQWHAGRHISQFFSALLFCGREVMMALMCREMSRRPGLRFSE